jgi:hypothetical protein
VISHRNSNEDDLALDAATVSRGDGRSAPTIALLRVYFMRFGVRTRMLMKWVPRDALGSDGNSEVEIRNKLPVRDLLRELKPDPRKPAEPPGQC